MRPSNLILSPGDSIQTAILVDYGPVTAPVPQDSTNLAELLEAPLITRDAKLARSTGHTARIEYIE